MKKCNQRNSGIGGQAVLEGVMMRNGEDYAVAVRRSDGSITVKKEKYKGFFADSPLKKIPFIRGIFVFIDSMVLGLRCTDYSASIYAEDDPEEAEKASSAKKSTKSTPQAEESGAAAGERRAAAGEAGDRCDSLAQAYDDRIEHAHVLLGFSPLLHFIRHIQDTAREHEHDPDKNAFVV